MAMALVFLVSTVKTNAQGYTSRVQASGDKGTVINNELTAGNVKLNPRSMNVYLDGNVIDLPHKEFLILKVLLENKGAVVSRDNLIVRIWGYDYDGDERILDNHIKKLRNALGKEGSRIKTVIRRGYKIID